MHIGDLKIDNLYIGNIEVGKIYLGGNLVYPSSNTYKVVEVKFDGNSYFDTGIKYDDNYKPIDVITVDARLTRTSEEYIENPPTVQFLVGSSQTIAGRLISSSLAFAPNTNKDYVGIRINQGQTSARSVMAYIVDGAPGDREWFNFRLRRLTDTQVEHSFNGREAITDDGFVFSFAEKNNYTATYLVGAREATGMANAYRDEMKSVKFAQNRWVVDHVEDVVKYDFCFVECPDGKVRMYDRINNQLFDNLGTGSLQVVAYTGETITL